MNDFIKRTFYMTVMVMIIFLNTPSARAQDPAERQKPQLVEIQLDSKTNDSDALEIVKKLDPIFFDIAEEDKKNVNFFARYLSLDDTIHKNYILVTAEDAVNFYCTGHGCPFYIYRKNLKDQWSLFLSFQGFNIYQDINTKSDRPDNLITIGNMQGQRHISLWAWDGQSYSKINR